MSYVTSYTTSYTTLYAILYIFLTSFQVCAMAGGSVCSLWTGYACPTLSHVLYLSFLVRTPFCVTASPSHNTCNTPCRSHPDLLFTAVSTPFSGQSASTAPSQSIPACIYAHKGPYRSQNPLIARVLHCCACKIIPVQADQAQVQIVWGHGNRYHEALCHLEGESAQFIQHTGHC